MSLISINVNNEKTDYLTRDFIDNGLLFRMPIKSIQNCTINYAIANHSNLLSFIIYRIQQMFFAIFGFSDWQIARNDLINDHLKKNNYVDYKQITEASGWTFIADRMLQTWVDAYNLPKDRSSDFFIPDSMNAIGKDHYIHYQRNDANSKFVFPFSEQGKTEERLNNAKKL